MGTNYQRKVPNKITVRFHFRKSETLKSVFKITTTLGQFILANNCFCVHYRIDFWQFTEKQKVGDINNVILSDNI